MAGISSDNITKSLSGLVKGKQAYEEELRKQMRITGKLKEEVQHVTEQLAKHCRENNNYQDSRQMVMDKLNDLRAEAARLEEDNRDCGAKVDSLEKQMLEVREQQRANEYEYTVMMNETRENITSAKNNYSPDLVAKRTHELRKKKDELFHEYKRLDNELKRSADIDNRKEKGLEVWNIIKDTLEH